MKQDRITTYIILAIYCFLIGFAIISLINPKWLQQLAEPGRTTEAKSLTEPANKYMYQGNFNAAIPLYVEALKIDTGNLNTYGNLANACIRIGKYDLARQCLNEVERLNSGLDSLAFYIHFISLGDLEKGIGFSKIKQGLNGKGNLINAYQYYGKTIQLMSYDPILYYKQAHLAMQMKLDSIAIEGFKKGIKINEDIESIYYTAFFSEYSKALANQNTDLSDELEDILHAEPENIEWEKYDTLSLIESRRKMPQLAQAYINLGELLLRNGDKELAESAFQQSLALNPYTQRAISKIKLKYP